MPRQNGVRVAFNPATSDWVFVAAGDSRVRSIRSGDPISTLAVVSSGIEALTISDDGSTLYYCDTLGQLHQRNLASSMETPLPLLVPGLTCTGYTLRYDQTSSSLIFPFADNGLTGVGVTVHVVVKA